MTRPVVDGQRKPREPELRIDLLDSVGVDLRMTPLPLVFEYQSMAPFYECGGWVDTVPASLRIEDAE